jgi:hypothetical protein
MTTLAGFYWRNTHRKCTIRRSVYWYIGWYVEMQEPSKFENDYMKLYEYSRRFAKGEILHTEYT